MGDLVVVSTDLLGRVEAATGICGGVSSYLFANDADPTVSALEVRASDGSVLIRRDDMSDPC